MYSTTILSRYVPTTLLPINKHNWTLEKINVVAFSRIWWRSQSWKFWSCHISKMRYLSNAKNGIFDQSWDSIRLFYQKMSLEWDMQNMSQWPRIGGSIIVRLVSSLTGLDPVVLVHTNKQHIFLFGKSNPTKLETSNVVKLPPTAIVLWMIGWFWFVVVLKSKYFHSTKTFKIFNQSILNCLSQDIF